MKKRIKAFLIVISTAICLFGFCLNAFASRSPNYGSYVNYTVYPGQKLVITGSADCATDGTTWTGDALKMRIRGAYSESELVGALKNVVFEHNGNPAYLGGETIAPSYKFGEYKGPYDTSKVYYIVAKGDKDSSELAKAAGNNGHGHLYLSIDQSDWTSMKDLKESLEYYGMEDYACVLSGFDQSTNGRGFAIGSNKQRSSDYNYIEAYMFDYNPNVANAKIYPDAYEDVVYLTESDIIKLCPWYGEYDTSGRISYQRAQELRNQYAGTYCNKNYLNSIYQNITKTNDVLFYYDLGVYDICRLGTYSDRLLVNCELYDLIDTCSDVTVDYVPNYSYNRREDEETIPESTMNYINSLRSTFYISTDNQSWQQLGPSGICAEEITFDPVTKQFSIGRTQYAMPENLASSNAWYIMRISSATGALAAYNGKQSPSLRIRPTLTLDSVDLEYTGPGVTEGTYLTNLADITVHAHYSSGDIDYSGNGSYITYTGTKIINVGPNNAVYFTFTDPLTGTIKRGTVFVKGLERKPLSISASYEGEDIVEGLSYALEDLRIHVVYNNNTVADYFGTSPNVGTLSTQFFGRGDVDLNGALNTADAEELKRIIAGTSLVSPGSDLERQADVNSDGRIDTADLTMLSGLISRTVNTVGRNIFYATFAGLMSADGKSPVYAPFYITGVAKKPYKLYISQVPTKVSYVEGENFDPSGMILSVFYDNGTSKTVVFDGNQSETGLSFGNEEFPARNLKTTQSAVAVSYTENGATVETQIRINVSLSRLTSIRITKAPDVTVYYSGENFKNTGMVVKAYFDEDVNTRSPKEYELAPSDYRLSNNKRMLDATNYVVIKAETINPSDSVLVSQQGYLRIEKASIISGLSMEVGSYGTYDYQPAAGITKSITGTIVGNHLVKVSFTSRGTTKTAFQPVTVEYKKLTGLEIQSMPYTTSYLKGQAFETAGLLLRASYTDGSIEYIYKKTDTANGFVVTNGDSLTADQSSVNCTYTENGTTQEVNIPVTVTDPTIDSISAQYTGENLFTGDEFSRNDVLIIVTFNDGSVNTFRASETNGDGTYKVKFVLPEADHTTVNMSAPETRSIYQAGLNYFAAVYSGKTSIFTINGVEEPGKMDFSGTVARSRRKYSTWSEDFHAIKIKSVADYIRGEVDLAGTVSIDEYHVTNPQSPTDTRTYLTEDEGTAKGMNLSGTLVSPLLSFIRQGNWRQPETLVSVRYRGRTHGYLFPETTQAGFGEEGSYLDKYGQNRSLLSADASDGWSDWVSNGDSVGTVSAERIAYNYSAPRDADTEETMCLDRVRIALDSVPAGSTANLLVKVENTSGAVTTYNGITESDVITDPARINIQLAGDISVVDNYGNTVSKPFKDVYKIFYRASTDDYTKWSQAGEWAGISNIHMQTLEIKLMLIDEFFEIGSTTDAPVITQQPRAQSANIGQNATFALAAVGNTLTYQWYSIKDGYETDISGATGNVYTTDDLYAEDNGTRIYCKVSNGVKTVKSDTVLLTVTDSMPTLTENITDVEADLDEEVTLSVEAFCYDTSSLVYDWQKSRSKETWTSFGTENEITFRMTDDMHGMYIRCKVSNSRGYVYSNTIIVSAKTAPSAEITCITEYLVQSTTVAATFSVVSSTNTTVTKSYTWLVDGVHQAESGTKLSYIPKALGTHTVSCTVKTQYGETTAEKTFYVGKKPTGTFTITQTENGGKIDVTATASITSFDGNGCRIYWGFDGELISSSGDNFTVSDGGKTFTVTGLDIGTQHSVAAYLKDTYGEYTIVPVGFIASGSD